MALADEALGNLSGLEGVVDAETVDVRVDSSSLNMCDFFDFLIIRIHFLVKRGHREEGAGRGLPFRFG